MAKFEIVYNYGINACEKVVDAKSKMVEAENKDKAIQKLKEEVPFAEVLKVIKYMEW